jgi:hypothetical protein
MAPRFSRQRKTILKKSFLDQCDKIGRKIAIWSNIFWRWAHFFTEKYREMIWAQFFSNNRQKFP